MKYNLVLENWKRFLTEADMSSVAPTSAATSVTTSATDITAAVEKSKDELRKTKAKDAVRAALTVAKEQAKALLAQGSWLLLVAVDEEQVVHGAASVNFINMPNDRIAFVTAIGGKLISNQDTYAQLCEVLKGFGATKIQGAARESIARLWSRYGFKERYIIVEAKI